MWAQILATSAAAALVSPVSAKGPWCILWDVVNIRKLLGPTAGTLVSSIVAFPPSTTSRLWRNSWPLKPDVVAEGGNATIDDTNVPAVGPSRLRILTTSP